MTDDKAESQSTPLGNAATKDSTPNSIYLVSYPKVVFLYPTVLADCSARSLCSTLVNQTQFATPALSEIPKRSLKHPAVENRHHTAAQVAEERRAA